MAILRAIVAGERNPLALADLKHGRIQCSTTEIAAALTGDYRGEHVFILQEELSVWEFYQAQIAAGDCAEHTSKADRQQRAMPSVSLPTR